MEKYNLKDELLAADKRLTGSVSLLGMTALTSPTYNNSMRSVMFCSHLKQFVNLLHPDFPGFFTNAENLVGDNSTAYKKAKHNYTVIRKITKFEKIVDKPNYAVFFIYDSENDMYDIVERTDSENLTEVFGYTYQNEYLDNLCEGDKIPAGTVMSKSSSFDDDMLYGYGKNVTMMYTLEPFTSEDACVISESFAKSLESIEINTVSMGVNQNDYLLNLYGDRYEYKPFPDIGEYSFGEVAAKRTLFNNQLLTDFKDSALSQIQDGDISLYKRGEVMDITIYSNNPDLPDTPFNRQIKKYLDAQTEFYREIAYECKRIRSSGSGYSRNLDYLYKRAKAFLDEDAKWKDDTVFSNLLIEIEVKETTPAHVGQKLTGRHGNKSVISQIRPDDEMPYYYDDNGKKVVIDLLFNVLAIINRTTAFPMYELSINFICNKTRVQMSKLKSRAEQEELLFGMIHEFNEKQAKEMKEVYDKLSDSDKNDYIKSCIEERIFIHQPPMWETKPIFFRLRDIYAKYDFLNPYDIYVDKWGRSIKCLNPAYIGEMYILKLKQSSRKGFSVRNTGSINNKGLPERSYKNKSFTERISTTPIRFGEFETLNFSIAILPEDIQLFHLMYRTSSKGRRELAERLLKSDDEFDISSSYTSRVAEIFSVILKSLGLKLEFVDDEQRLEEYDNDVIRSHFLNGKEFLCTDYEFMLAERKYEIEKEILDNVGIIDVGELRERVYHELETRDFLIGPSVEEVRLEPAYTW